MIMTTRAAFEIGTDTFNAHDIDGFANVLADDVVFTAPGGMRGAGKPACLEFFGSWWNAFPDFHIEVHDVHFMDDVAVEEGSYTGVHNGVLHTPMGELSPTGRGVRGEYVQVLRFRDGKHASFNLMFDRLQLLEQLGVIPAPVSAS
jgi:ketosteroid isomerase-like protein